MNFAHLKATRTFTRQNPMGDTPEEVALRRYEIGLDYQGISDHIVYETSEEIKQEFGNFTGYGDTTNRLGKR